MPINSIYTYLREELLKEELHVDGLNFLGNAYGFDLYNAVTYDGAQALTVGDSDRLAGEGWTGSESTFNSHINDTVKLYLFVKENTNKAVMGVISGAGNGGVEIEERFNINIPGYSFQNIEGGNEVFDHAILPLFLLPNISYQGHDGLILQDQDIIGSYKGLIDPTHMPESLSLSNIRNIKTDAFNGYPVPEIIIEDTVTNIASNAFRGYEGTIKCFAESYNDTVWSASWAGGNENVIWAINLTPEEIARREEAARLERERIEREQREREEAERREREFQAAETISVLRYKKVGNEITILGCKKGRQKLDIPAEIEGCPVTTVGPLAFYSNQDLTEVKLPETIKTIGKAAFYNCSNCYVYYPKKATLYTDALTGVRRQYAQ